MIEKCTRKLAHLNWNRMCSDLSDNSLSSVESRMRTFSESFAQKLRADRKRYYYPMPPPVGASLRMPMVPLDSSTRDDEQAAENNRQNESETVEDTAGAATAADEGEGKVADMSEAEDALSGDKAHERKLAEQPKSTLIAPISSLRISAAKADRANIMPLHRFNFGVCLEE